MESSSSHVCFSCRIRRSLPRFEPYKRDEVPCPQCNKPMLSIGKRLQVPRKDDSDAWDEFWRQFISPGYGVKGIPEIDAENQHFEACKAKKREPPRAYESTGCEKCDKVWARMPEAEKDRWRTSLRSQWQGSQ